MMLQISQILLVSSSFVLFFLTLSHRCHSIRTLSIHFRIDSCLQIIVVKRRESVMLNSTSKNLSSTRKNIILKIIALCPMELKIVLKCEIESRRLNLLT